MNEDYSAEAEAVSNTDLDEIADLAARQVWLEDQITVAEEVLKEKKRMWRQIAEDELPSAMAAVGMETFQLTDGSKISVKEDWKASITNRNRNFVMDWLKETGNDGIISNEIKVLFGKGDEKEAANLFSALGEDGQDVYQNETVNTGTLKALCRELMEKGIDIPVSELGMFVVRKAVIKMP